MDEHQPVPDFNPQSNQPSTRQWILIGVVGFIAACGLLLFLSGGALTIFSWYGEMHAQATETAAAATAVVVERDLAMKEASTWPLLISDTFDDMVG